ncbi:MAG TPA: MBL fold metallo-hydrolase [Gemmatimonadaceae bacterium]|nr:MBL fold metallo-hydrolase [Gemmatimonadaceae bacterium]
MIEILEHGDVRRVRMWTRRSVMIGYDVSAYLVGGLLVDTGFRHVAGDFARVLVDLAPRGVVVTHWHEDHAGNAPDVAMSGVPIWMHEFTQRKLREHEQLKLYRRVVWGRPVALHGVITPFDPSPLQVIATPGHSADHHVVWDARTRTLFSGDLWLGVKVRVLGAEENPYAIIESLRAAIALEPARMFDAHRGLVANPVEMLRAKRDWMQNTIGTIEQLLDAGAGESEILNRVLGGDERSAFFSQGEYSRRNFVRTVARNRATGSRLPPSG